jgi:Cytochrome c7 and related cytochrome c
MSFPRGETLDETGASGSGGTDPGWRFPRRRRRATVALARSALLAGLIACGHPPPPAAEAPAPAPAAGAAAAAEAPAATPGDVSLPGEVPMDHKVHAGDLKMPCLGCHVYADKAPSAGLPSGRKCMGCHKFVAKDKPAVQLLARRFEAGQPLRWKRLYVLPDFIYFSHRAHVLKKVDCKECHGDMAANKVIVPFQLPFTMGRCLECHEAKKASRDCLACHK